MELLFTLGGRGRILLRRKHKVITKERKKK